MIFTTKFDRGIPMDVAITSKEEHQRLLNLVYAENVDMSKVDWYTATAKVYIEYRFAEDVGNEIVTIKGEVVYRFKGRSGRYPTTSRHPADYEDPDYEIADVNLSGLYVERVTDDVYTYELEFPK